jgi:hypothetical protein
MRIPGAIAHADVSSVTAAIKTPSRPTDLVRKNADIVFDLFIKRVHQNVAFTIRRMP